MLLCYLLPQSCSGAAWWSPRTILGFQLGKLLLPLASLLSGVAMLVVGTGLLFAAIGAQSGAARFSALVTGLIMSGYFAGFIFGTYACPIIIRRVGHIRAFAAMASIASTLPILHALWLNA